MMTQSLQLSCPVCNHQQIFNYHNRLNIATNPALKESLLMGDMFRFECDNCGAKRQLDMQFLYHDPEKKIMIFLLPDYQTDKDNVLKTLDELLVEQGLPLHDYTLRIVLHGTDLVEKIHIYDNNLTDAEVELVKLLTDGLFAQDKPTTPVKARYFYPSDNGKKILYITDKEQLAVDFHEKLLGFVRTKFNKKIEQLPKGEFIVLNHNWAMRTVENKSEEV